MTRLANDSSGVGFTGGSPIQSLYNGTGQNITVDATSKQSTAFGLGTTVIRIVGAVDFWYKIGPNPSAAKTGDSAFLKAGVVEFPQVCRGDKIAVTQDAGGGNVNIVEMI